MSFYRTLSDADAHPATGMCLGGHLVRYSPFLSLTMADAFTRTGIPSIVAVPWLATIR